MRVLSHDNDVVWVNYHGSRRPRLNMQDARGIVRVLRHAARGARPVSERMTQFTPLVWPGSSSPLVTRLNRTLVAGQIRRVIARQRRSAHQPIQLWTFAPDVAYLAGAFGEECLVYYCVDEFSQFEEFDEQAVVAAERRLIAAADVVFTTSAKLYETKSALHSNVHLVRHGVDVPHFARAVDRKLRLPEPIRHLQPPLAGFIGLVHHWIDVDLLAGVARKLPHISFVMVGECKTDVSALKALDNVHFTGRQPYGLLPAYCSAFDIGLMPFKLTRMTENVNPIKLREYLAAGLPVVSTSIPEARGLVPPSFLADDSDGFAAACEHALKRSTLATRAVTSAMMEGHSWQRVARRVSWLVSQVVHQPQRPHHPGLSPPGMRDRDPMPGDPHPAKLLGP